ncbi:MAG: hypothetical protein Hyperionvirus4_112 [Hyperionvirus sp.]|uniref:Ankyrin repeat protein n=1 Tax=Hyperionvirus sp. TaxID=2487770 RepID=A0A3G5A7C9_9VIRU|nr:MAG: hypothetical protein Hyperionvirus4_112 [Hyperionvirus sp.]
MEPLNLKSINLDYWINFNSHLSLPNLAYSTQLNRDFLEAITLNNDEKIEAIFLNFPNRKAYESTFNAKQRFNIFMTTANFGRTTLLRRLEKLTDYQSHTEVEYRMALIKAIENGHIDTVKYLLILQAINRNHNYYELLDKCFGRSIDPNSDPYSPTSSSPQEGRYAQYKIRNIKHEITNCDNEDIARRELFAYVYSLTKAGISITELAQLAHGAIYFGFDQITLYIFSLLIPEHFEIGSWIHYELQEFYRTATDNNRWNIISQLLKLSENLDSPYAFSQLYSITHESTPYILDELFLYVKLRPHKIKTHICDEFLNGDKNILRCMKLERNMNLECIEGFDSDKFHERKKNVLKIMTPQFPEVLINIMIDYC